MARFPLDDHMKFPFSNIKSCEVIEFPVSMIDEKHMKLNPTKAIRRVMEGTV